jgi:UDP-N-acetylglucosamine 1-carboxyvinyltransferase
VDRFEIKGGTRLTGEVTVKGAKNAALPLMAAAIMGTGTSRIHGVPRLRDIKTLMKILAEVGVRAEWIGDNTLEITPEDESQCRAPHSLVSEMRGSFCVLGPLLARRRRAEVSLPGGCAIGVRPVNLHMKGLRALGMNDDLVQGYVCATTHGLTGAEVYLGGPFGSTVLGTANVLSAACLAEGTTIIECAACEPEIVDLIDFLTKMGAEIEGAGSHRLVVHGVEELHGAEHTVIPDRIEAATFLTAAAMTRGDLTIRGLRTVHLTAVIDVLREIGVVIEPMDNACRVVAENHLNATDVVALPYPGVPTDVQAQISAVLATAEGTSVVTDKVFPDRFMHVAELARMGVDVRKEMSSAIIVGRSRIMGAEVTASDLRASAALVLAGIAAERDTVVHRVYHIDRGYQDIEARLNALGAHIERTEEPPKGVA